MSAVHFLSNGNVRRKFVLPATSYEGHVNNSPRGGVLPQIWPPHIALLYQSTMRIATLVGEANPLALVALLALPPTESHSHDSI